MPIKTCATCLYNNNGYCHAHPPTWVHVNPNKIDEWSNNEALRFPRIKDTDLACREYKKK